MPVVEAFDVKLPRRDSPVAMGRVVNCLNIAVHDFAGHPFQAQLSRALANRGYGVIHQYVASDPGPKGTLRRRSDDPEGLTFDGLIDSRMVRKRVGVGRAIDEARLGVRIAESLTKRDLDIAILCNLPAYTLPVVTRRLRSRLPYIIWLQDLWSLAFERLHLPFGLGRVHFRMYRALERQALAGASAVVCISERFAERVSSCVPEKCIRVIPNWAPLGEIPLRPRANAWAERHRLTDVHTILYTGTMGLKHDWEALFALAKALETRNDVRLVIVGSGVHYNALRQQVENQGLCHVRFLPLQPMEEFPDVLASADVFVATLTPEGGGFAVPSKILSYLAAGRPTVYYGPLDSDVSSLLSSSGGGVSVPFGETETFVETVLRLLDDGEAREQMGRQARRYAETAFDIEKIADLFEEVLESATRLK